MENGDNPVNRRLLSLYVDYKKSTFRLMNIIARLFILCGLLQFSSSLPAQNKIVDSLTILLAKETSVKQKARLQIKIGKEYISVDTLKSIEYFEKGFALANEAGDEMSKGMYHLYKAYLLCNKGKFEDGLNRFNEASLLLNRFLSGKKITALEKEEADGFLLDAELSRGNVYLELYEYDKAVEMFWKVLKQFNKTNIPDKDIAIASIYHSIALAYYHQAQYQSALKYYLESLPYAEKGGNEQFTARTNIYIGMCYTLINKFDSTNIFLKKAEPIALSSNDASLKTQFYARSAEWARFTGQWQRADDYYNKAIENAIVTGDTYMQTTFTHAKARCLLHLNRIDEARQTALNALHLAESIDKKREILESQKVLAEVEAAAGNYKAAFIYIQKNRSGSDSLHSTELTEKIHALDKKYQSQLKDEQIALFQRNAELQQLNNEKKKLLNYLLAAALVLLFITSVFVYRNSKHKQKLQKQRISELETEKQLAATEAILKGEEQERTRLAKELHDGLGGMLSGIKYSLNGMKENLILTPENAQAFERSIDMLDSSIKEMRRVAHNMMPENLLKFGLDTALKDYCIDINQGSAVKVNYQSMGLENASINSITSIAIYRIVQELLNNILKHSGAQNAIVQVNKLDDKISVTVEDDGRGFDTVLLITSKGIGWSNIQNRVDFLKGKLDVNSEPGKGTSVLIELNG